MRKAITAFLLLILLSSCQRSCQKWKKENQTSKRNYTIEMYSGGKTIFEDRFHGIVTEDSGGSSCYYYKGDTLIELFGDYIIKSTK